MAIRSNGHSSKATPARGKRNSALIEPLEDRLFLSASLASQSILASLRNHAEQAVVHRVNKNIGQQVATPIAIINTAKPASTSPGGSSLTPVEVAAAYGINDLTFGNVQGDGAGQTIAIVDAYDDPNAASDLHQFDVQFGLPDAPSFERLNQSGVAGSYPSTDPAGAGNSSGTWELEESLDIEWAHAIAPDANIDLVEASSPTDANLIQNAVNTARNLPGVVAVSMSFSSSESSNESSYDTYFTTPSGHPGVTFLAATGDNGKPGGYPAYSSDVVAVGGTTLYQSNGTYESENAWSGSGGGISQVESQPSYQKGIVSQSSTARTIPDVSIDADPNSGVAVYDSYDDPSSPWIQIGGTSLATPMWAGLIAIADQGRSLASLPSLDGATQTLPSLYKLPAADFHDVTSGSNGFSAGTGYDLVTGRGTPIANVLDPALAGVESISGSVFQDNNGDGILDSGDTPISGATVYLDANNNGLFDAPATTTASSSTVASINTGSTSASSVVNVSGTTSSITNVSVTVNLNDKIDSNLSAYLIGPDGTTVKLVGGIGGSGQNFSNTTFSSSAAASITSASAPFTGTFTPSPGELIAFSGKSANGNWTLKITDSTRGDSASIQNWSLSVTTGELSTTANANGQYAFNSVPAAAYTLRQLVPANDIQVAPAPAADILAASSSVVAGQNFGDFPTVFSIPGDSQNEYVTLDSSGSDLQIFNAAAPGQTPAYQIPLADLPSLTFNLQGTNDTVYVDFANGPPIPAGGLNVNGVSGSGDGLEVIGQSPAQTLTMTDTQIALANGPAISFQNVDTLTVSTVTVDYTGDFSTFPNLVIDGGSTFIIT